MRWGDAHGRVYDPREVCIRGIGGTRVRFDFDAGRLVVSVQAPAGGGGGGSLSDGTYGDIQVSGGGTNFQVRAGVVGNMEMAAMPTMTLKGNDTGGAASPQDLTVGEVLAMLGGGGSLLTAMMVRSLGAM